MVEKL
jgi:hypothetical protein